MMRRTLSILTLIVCIAVVVAGMVSTPVIVAEDGLGNITEDMPPFELWQLILSAFLPGIVQWVKGRNWPSEWSRTLMIVIAAAVAVGGAWFRGELDDWKFTSGAVLTLIFMTHLSYETIWKSSMLVKVTDELGKRGPGSGKNEPI